MCKWCEWVLVWGWVLIRCWLFHCWWICLRRWMFLWGGNRKGGGVDGLVWLSEGKVWYWPKGVLTRARMRALVLGVLFFLLSQVSQRMGLRILHYFKNDVWFYGKWRVVLWKVTCRFGESDVLFWIGGSKSCFEDGVLVCFWGGVAAWKCDIFWMLFLLSV